MAAFSSLSIIAPQDKKSNLLINNKEKGSSEGWNKDFSWLIVCFENAVMVFNNQPISRFSTFAVRH